MTTPYPSQSCPFDNDEGINELKRGNEQVWREVVRCYSSRLRHDILTSLMKRSMPDWSLLDIEQETWLIASDKIDMFVWRGHESFYHWLRVIATYCILNRLPRFRQFGNSISLEEIGESETRSGTWLDRFLWTNHLIEDDPEDEVVDFEQRATMLQLIISDENPTHIAIAIQRWVHGKKPQELAELYGIKSATVSQILWLMKKRLVSLRNCWKEEFRET